MPRRYSGLFETDWMFIDHLTCSAGAGMESCVGRRLWSTSGVIVQGILRPTLVGLDHWFQGGTNLVITFTGGTMQNPWTTKFTNRGGAVTSRPQL